MRCRSTLTANNCQPFGIAPERDGTIWRDDPVAVIVIGAVIGFGVAPTLVTLIADSLGGEHALRYGLALTGAGASIIATVGFAGALLRAHKAQA